MLLSQENLRIPQTPCRGEAGSVAGAAQTTEQAGFGTTLERGVNRKTSAGFEVTAKSPTGEKQGHGWSMSEGESGRRGRIHGRQEGRDVCFLFVLHFCARPLAGPPGRGTDSAIAPDLQASAVTHIA